MGSRILSQMWRWGKEAGWRGWGWGPSGIPVRLLNGSVLPPRLLHSGANLGKKKDLSESIKGFFFSKWTWNFLVWQWSYGNIYLISFV